MITKEFKENVTKKVLDYIESRSITDFNKFNSFNIKDILNDGEVGYEPYVIKLPYDYRYLDHDIIIGLKYTTQDEEVAILF